MPNEQIINGTYYHQHTPQAVISVLEQARQNHRRIRIRLGDSATGRDWLEEWDVEGYVGRSMGPMRVPLLLHNARSNGGGAILDHCIIKVRTTGRNGRVLFQHPTYHHGQFEIKPGDMEGYAETVYVNGEVHARFKRLGQARRWVEKMS